jgi:hypothetical protein
VVLDEIRDNHKKKVFFKKVDSRVTSTWSFSNTKF